MTVADLSVATDDFDTLGGRLSRSRDAKNMSLEHVAELSGVEIGTLEAWECDRAEPRSNRLTMLAGILGVSPSWLLFGRGASPLKEFNSTSVNSIETQLGQLKLQHREVSAAIRGIEETLSLDSVRGT